MIPKKLIALSLCVLFFCSCFESSNPLSDPVEAKVDERLEGIWVWKGDKGERLYAHFTRGDKDPFMSLVMVQNGIVYDKSVNPEIFFPTHLDSGSYLNIQRWLPSEEKFSDYYVFYKYEITKNKLYFWMFANRKPIIKAVEDGELKGRLTKLEDEEITTVDRIEILEDSEKIADFLATHDGEIFDSDPMVFRKIPEN